MHTIKFLNGSTRQLSSLVGANLAGADLEGADLANADLARANLPGAYLAGADLPGAYLAGANLAGANLAGANLEDADLVRANLPGADLAGANLPGADLSNADLARANLAGADLAGANLVGANLAGADLAGANLTNARLPHFQICPEKGCFRAFKKINTKYGIQVIELEIAASAKRTSSLVGRKCRASKARIVTRGVDGRSLYTSAFKYVSGVELVVEDYDDDIRVECTRGIHFFMTFAEASAY